MLSKTFFPYTSIMKHFCIHVFVSLFFSPNNSSSNNNNDNNFFDNNNNNNNKFVDSENIILEVDTVIKELDQEGTYKYLGVNEGDGIQHAKMK